MPPELLQLVEHIVVAHLNHPEWGSPRLPLIPEVLILHHLEDLDAKVAELKRRGWTKANKSQLIRLALSQIDLDKLPTPRQ